MSYNSVGGITKKTQVHKKGEQEQKKTTYDLSYTYGETQPHAPIHIGDRPLPTMRTVTRLAGPAM